MKKLTKSEQNWVEDMRNKVVNQQLTPVFEHSKKHKKQESEALKKSINVIDSLLSERK